MRMLFGVISLLLVLAVVGILSKKQVSAIDNINVSAGVAAAAGASAPLLQTTPGATAQQQSQQIQAQFKAATEAALQPVRQEPDEK